MSSVPPWAKRGTQVVCISDGGWETSLPIPTRVPMVGEILTIAAVRVYDKDHRFANLVSLAGAYLAFDEIPLRQTADGLSADLYWDIGAFRPLIKSDTSMDHDVALFEKFLQGHRVKTPGKVSV